MTAASGVRSRALEDVLARGPHAAVMQEQVRRVGGCEQPIRLRGRADLMDVATGEVRRSWSSEELPDGTVLVACGNRRASRCGPCSRLYQGDAYQLVHAGLTGGKDVPSAVAAHTTLFVTLTAPSFGPVHTTRLDRHGRHDHCHRARGLCPHGRPRACQVRHEPGDWLLGQPLCAECFDYEAAVLWNAHCSELWRRTRIGIYRQLARLCGISERQVKHEVSVQYVKVAEFQRRGLLHFHLAVRLDSAELVTDETGARVHAFAPPPAGYTAELLTEAIRAAVAHAQAPYPTPAQPATAPVEALPLPGELPVLRLDTRDGLRAARWGGQLHIEPIPADDPAGKTAGLERGQVAGYLAKYATKHTEALGGLDRRVRLTDLRLLLVNPHIRRLVATALLLTAHYPPPEHGRDLKLARWAHQLGYGGHWLTKSHHYSTTFTALRAARKQWQAARNPDPADPHPADETAVASWRLAGIGYRLTGDAWLAEIARERAAAARELEREDRAQRQLAEALVA